MHLDLRAPHLEQDVEGLLHGARFGLGRAHAGGKTDEPQTVAVTEQTLCPLGWIGIETLCQLVGHFDFLCGTNSNV